MQLLTSDMRFVAAPMVGQSDLPFRILVQNHGATLAYTQMLYPSRLESDPEYLAFHRRDLSLSPHPVIVQLCGNNADQILRGARKVVDLCDGIGCPQDHAREGHYGAYLLRENDWALDESIVAALAQGVSVPVSAKMRLSPGGIDSTVAFGQRLRCAGARFLVLHARYASARRRRHGPANLEAVKALVESVDIPVISNGNVRTWADVQANEAYTGARGIMVGETLLGNPCIFENRLLDPVDISLEYLDLCRTYSDTVSLSAIQAHVRHFIEFQCERRSWYSTFKDELSRCSTIDSIESLLQGHVRDWVSGLEPGRKSKTNPGVDEALDVGLASLYSI